MPIDTDKGVCLRYNDFIKAGGVKKDLEFEVAYGFKKSYIAKAYTLKTGRGLDKKLRTYIYIPRSYAYGIGVKSKSKYKHDSVDWQNPITLMEGQDDLVSRSMELLKSRKCVLLNLGTGSGKTYVSIALLAKLAFKALIITPNKNILVQTRGVLQNSGVPENCYTLIVVNSWQKCDFTKYGAIFIDEIHGIPSNTRVSLLWKASIVPYIIGASATIDHRNDDKDPLYKVHFTGAIIKNHIEEYFKGDFHVIKYTGEQETVLRDGRPNLMETLRYSYNHQERYDIVLSQIAHCIDKGHKCILVYTRLCEHGRELCNQASKLFSDKKCYTFMGGSKNLDEAQNSGDILFCTFKYAEEGFSLPRATGLIIADAKKTKVAQLFGRVTRRGSLKHITRYIAYVFDVNTFIYTYIQYAVAEAKTRKWKIHYNV